jgi:beta-glucosidase-like glycosyl hydrolase
VGVLSLALAGCSSAQDAVPERAAAPAPRHSAGPWIPGFVADMSEADEVGQLFAPSVDGRDHALSLISKYHVGGFVYGAADTRSPAQTAQLSNALQDASDLPLLIGLGTESAGSYFTPLPGDQAIAADRSPADARAIARVAGTEGRAVGVTPAYGPVTGDGALHLARGRKLRGDGAVRAVKGGADQLIDPPDLSRAYKAVLKAVQRGTIPQHRLDEAVARILRLKQARGLFRGTIADPGKAGRIVGSAADRAIVRTVAEHSITLVRNDPPSGRSRPLLPLGSAQVYVTGPAAGRVSAALREVGLHMAKSARKADAAVLTTRDAKHDIGPRVRSLDHSAPVIVISLGSPDDLADARRATAAVAAYGDDAPSLSAMAGVLTGTVRPTGRLPVKISNAYPKGHGLSLPT